MDGKKATVFSQMCSALGVSFNLRGSSLGQLEIKNTPNRIKDLVEQLAAVLEQKKLSRHEALKLRGRLGFADGFLHGRLGALVLKRLVDHAYGASTRVDDDMAEVLQFTEPRLVSIGTVKEWMVFTDASYSREQQSSGLGGVLIAADGNCNAWFSLKLERDHCLLLGCDHKETIIYELELLAACIALSLWAGTLASSYPVHYGDNDGVRYTLIRGSAVGPVAQAIVRCHLEIEVRFNSNIWFARVPTEANIADIPSRFEEHPLLQPTLEASSDAWKCLETFLKEVQRVRCSLESSGEGSKQTSPHVKKKKRSLLELHMEDGAR